MIRAVLFSIEFFKLFDFYSNESIKTKQLNYIHIYLYAKPIHRQRETSAICRGPGRFVLLHPHSLPSSDKLAGREKCLLRLCTVPENYILKYKKYIKG